MYAKENDPYPCNNCDKRCKTKSRLRDHNLLDHKHPCNLCDKKFVAKIHLKKHLSSKHRKNHYFEQKNKKQMNSSEKNEVSVEPSEKNSGIPNEESEKNRIFLMKNSIKPSPVYYVFRFLL